GDHQDAAGDGGGRVRDVDGVGDGAEGAAGGEAAPREGDGAIAQPIVLVDVERARDQDGAAAVGVGVVEGNRHGGAGAGHDQAAAADDGGVEAIAGGSLVGEDDGLPREGGGGGGERPLGAGNAPGDVVRRVGPRGDKGAAGDRDAGGGRPGKDEIARGRYRL